MFVYICYINENLIQSKINLIVPPRLRCMYLSSFYTVIPESKFTIINIYLRSNIPSITPTFLFYWFYSLHHLLVVYTIWGTRCVFMDMRNVVDIVIAHDRTGVGIHFRGMIGPRIGCCKIGLVVLWHTKQLG